MYLYPRIPLSTARQIAEQLGTEPVQALRERHSDERSLIDPLRSIFAATGGTRADIRVLANCRTAVRAAADACGFPDAPSVTAAQAFDVEAAITLFETMRITPAEASALEVWAHMTCIMMPDIVRWRYSGERTPHERFIGSGQGRRRNTFGRLWWRAYLFRDEQNERDPFWLLRLLGEDDYVQITERPSIAGRSALTRQIVVSLYEVWRDIQQNGSPPFSERELLRDALKRIRRRLSVTAFDLLGPDVLKEAVCSIFKTSASALYRANES